jgi:hypothetical protein
MRRYAMVAVLAGVLVSGVWAALAAQAQAEVVHPFLYSIQGLSEPCSVAVDSVGDIYVGNARSNKIYVYGPGVGHPRITEFRGERPCDLAVDSKGNVYAKEFCCPVEISLGKVVRFSPSAYPPTASTTYAAPVTLQTGEASSGVTAVAVGPDDHVYVDRESRIVELDSADAGNAILKSDIGSGTLNQSMAVEVSPSTGEIYAKDYRGFGGAVIDVFGSGGGSLETTIGATCTGTTFSEEGRIAADAPAGSLFVFEPSQGTVYELDRAEHCLSRIGPPFGETTITDTSPSTTLQRAPIPATCTLQVAKHSAHTRAPTNSMRMDRRLKVWRRESSLGLRVTQRQARLLSQVVSILMDLPSRVANSNMSTRRRSSRKVSRLPRLLNAVLGRFSLAKARSRCQ